MARRDDRASTRHVHRDRPDDAAPARDRRPALRAVADERAAPDRGALGRGALHREGGCGRLPPRRGDRVRDRRRPAPLARAPARRAPVHRRLADDPDPRDRADGRRLDGLARDARLVLGRDHRRVPDVLPRHDQHAARARLRRPARARADALLRGEQVVGALEAEGAGVAAVPLRRLQDLGDRERRRRDRRRAAVVDPGRPRRGDPQLQPVLPQLAAQPLGDEPRSPRCSASRSSRSSRSSSTSSSAAHRSTWRERTPSPSRCGRSARPLPKER